MNLQTAIQHHLYPAPSLPCPLSSSYHAAFLLLVPHPVIYLAARSQTLLLLKDGTRYGSYIVLEWRWHQDDTAAKEATSSSSEGSRTVKWHGSMQVASQEANCENLSKFEPRCR
jgi:hypothetical protein